MGHGCDSPERSAEGGDQRAPGEVVDRAIEQPDVEQMREERNPHVSGGVQSESAVADVEDEVAREQEMPAVGRDQELEKAVIDDLKEVEEVVELEITMVDRRVLGDASEYDG